MEGFRILGNTVRTINLADYVREYLKSHPNIQLLVGCDSQNRRRETVYALVVALYTPGKGAEVVYKRWTTPKEYVQPVRLINEVYKSVEVAKYLEDHGLPKVSWIDIDLNPDPKYKSNEVFRQACGLVEGMGYRVRYKSMGPVCTYTADMLVKH